MKIKYSTIFAYLLVLPLYACSSDDSPTNAPSEQETNEPTSTLPEGETDTPSETPSADLTINDPTAMAAAFAPYANKVSTRFDDTYFYVESDGIPEHQMMVNITAWIAQVPLPHPYNDDNAWSIPLSPEYAEDPISIQTDFQRGAIAIAANGIPIFNPLNASGLISKEIGELDDFGGHSGRADDYHYHAAPLHLENAADNPIAYAFDGFAIYGSTEPDGTPMQPLDSYHGHETSDGSYHYHGTETFPYLIGAMRGKVTLDPQTTAPQTQIIPQARTQPLRQSPHPINTDDLIITNLTENSTNNGYVLEYTSGGVAGSVAYSWTEADLFTFIFNDVDGSTTTETFQRTDSGPPADQGGDPPPDDPPATGDSGATNDSVATDDPAIINFALNSPAIENGLLLDEYKCERKSPEGLEDSIPLSWSEVPENTASLAIVMHHFPNPNDTSQANQYLLLWGIDPGVTEISHGEADDGNWYMGSNKDGNAISYTSPCSPSVGTHAYTITVYALSATPTSLPQANSLDVTYDVLLAAIETVTVLGKAELTFDDVTE